MRFSLSQDGHFMFVFLKKGSNANLNVAVLSEFLALLDRHRVCFKIGITFFADIMRTGKFAAPRRLRTHANRALREGALAERTTFALDITKFLKKPRHRRLWTTAMWYTTRYDEQNKCHSDE